MLGQPMAYAYNNYNKNDLVCLIGPIGSKQKDFLMPGCLGYPLTATKQRLARAEMMMPLKFECLFSNNCGNNSGAWILNILLRIESE